MKPPLLALLITIPLSLLANSEGGPAYRDLTGLVSIGGRTGYAPANEQTCEGSGCHRAFPFTVQGGRVTVDVGPYIPGQKQRVVVTIVDPNAKRWGFQLAARLLSDPMKQAGTFSPPADPEGSAAWVRVRCADGTTQPCGNQLEFATHTSVGTRCTLGSQACTQAGDRPVTFFLDWTAPSNDVGPIVFSATGMGADGDGSPSGDHTYNVTATSLFAPSNQPTLSAGGVANAASFTPNGAIASGTIVSLFGDKLAPPGFSRSVLNADLQRDGRLPIELSRTGADFFAPGFPDPIPAFILFISDKQLNVQVPLLPPGISQVEVQPVFNRGQGLNEIRGNRVTARAQPVSPGLFTFDGKSAAAVTPSGAPVGRVGQFPNSRPAHPGDVIVLFGTGFGTTNPDVEPGSLATGPATLTGNISVRIGGVQLAGSDILYAGAAPIYAGLQQFNVRIPSAVGTGDQPVVISSGGFDSQSTAIVTVQP